MLRRGQAPLQKKKVLQKTQFKVLRTKRKGSKRSTQSSRKIFIMERFFYKKPFNVMKATRLVSFAYCVKNPLIETSVDSSKT